MFDEYPLSEACYLMVDQEPVPDEFEFIPPMQVQSENYQAIKTEDGKIRFEKKPFTWTRPEQHVLKPKPFTSRVEQFLRKFSMLYCNGELQEIQDRIHDICFTEKSTGLGRTLGQHIVKIGMYLSANPSERISNPNDFRDIVLTTDELRIVAKRMGLTPKFLQGGDHVTVEHDLDSLTPDELEIRSLTRSRNEMKAIARRFKKENPVEWKWAAAKVIFPGEVKAWSEIAANEKSYIKSEKERIKKNVQNLAK